jgi:16S rRNA processing protein RimM
MRPEGFVAIGRFTKPHGLQGELLFLPYVSELALLPELSNREVLLQQTAPPTQVQTIVAFRGTPKRLLVQIAGCKTLTAAEALRGYEVLIPQHWFAPLPEGEYYWFEIEGLQVYSSDGRALGTIAEIIYTGSNDVYVVKNGAQEILIPALKQVVRSIDLTQRALHLGPADDFI